MSRGEVRHNFTYTVTFEGNFCVIVKAPDETAAVERARGRARISARVVHVKRG